MASSPSAIQPSKKRKKAKKEDAAKTLADEVEQMWILEHRREIDNMTSILAKFKDQFDTQGMPEAGDVYR